ncbi:MAG TPA: PQQ-binding-like beta-propeller repeat protein [Verrucomicrobiae bacterium]|nr:PQQ-binding-like beta-propeller repeat protein [Verrucomicrobiae bacterium]
MYDAGQTIYSSPALGTDGTIYLGAGVNFYAITNFGSGASNKWVFTTSAAVSAAPAIGPDGGICCVGGALYSLNPDGTERWHFGSGAGQGAAAIGFDGSIYFVGANGTLFAVSATGTQMWTAAVGNVDLQKSPTLGADGSIYLCASDLGALYSWNGDGTLKWQRALNGGSDSVSLASDGTIYVSAEYSLCAFASDGTSLWNYSTNGYADHCPVIGQGGTLYLAAWESEAPLGYIIVLRAILPTGVLNWEFKQPSSWGQAYGPPTPAVDSAGTIYYTGFGTLYAISANGQLEWTFNGGNNTDTGTYSYTSPLVGPDGTIYVTFGSKLYAIAGTNALAASPWPMYRQNPRRTGKVERPVLKQPHKRADANFEFQLYPQQFGLTYTIESSSNLNTWISLTSFVANTLPMDVLDLSASNAPIRFYRAFSGP